MAGIGEDIKEVLQELTTPFVISKLTGSPISGEFLDYEMYFDQSTEFIRQFCYSGTFQYDTQIEQGDLITFDSKNFLMMNVKKTLFENEVVDYSNFFILCNSLGKFSRGVEARSATTKEIGITWTNVQDNVNGCMLSRAVSEENIGAMQTIDDKFALYTQGYTTIRPGDRYYPDRTVATEYYQVISVDKYRFTGLLSISLSEDSRE